jgi:hypothetical protein
VHAGELQVHELRRAEPASTTRVPAPRQPSTSPADPMATISPPAIATAAARGRASSIVRMRALMMTSSADPAIAIPFFAAGPACQEIASRASRMRAWRRPAFASRNEGTIVARENRETLA